LTTPACSCYLHTYGMYISWCVYIQAIITARLNLTHVPLLVNIDYYIDRYIGRCIDFCINLNSNIS